MVMNDNSNELERLIREERAKLDDVEQPRVEKMWKAISRDLASSEDPPAGLSRKTDRGGWQLTIGRNWRWSIAATIVLAVLFSVFSPFESTHSPSPQLADYYPELADEVRDYQHLIAQKENEIKFSRLNHSEFPSIFEELVLLEKLHQEYLQDLPKFHDNDQLVQTLIKYYEQKIRILERLSLEIEKRQQYEKRTRERLM